MTLLLLSRHELEAAGARPTHRPSLQPDLFTVNRADESGLWSGICLILASAGREPAKNYEVVDVVFRVLVRAEQAFTRCELASIVASPQNFALQAGLG
jgi:hypothetical protein